MSLAITLTDIKRPVAMRLLLACQALAADSLIPILLTDA